MKKSKGIILKRSFSLLLTGRTRKIVLGLLTFALAITFVLVACSAPENQSAPSNNQPQAGAADWKPIEQALGKAGAVQPGDVYKVGLPRTDLQVNVNGVQVKPPLALGSWVRGCGGQLGRLAANDVQGG